MGFGWPTLYWQLSPKEVAGGVNAYDKAVGEASVEYGGHTVSSQLSIHRFSTISLSAQYLLR